MNVILKGYSIRNSKASNFAPPLFANTHGEAEQIFTRIASGKESFINQFPEDFDLYYVGDFDTESGKMVGLATPQHIVKAVQVLNRGINPASSVNENAVVSALQ